MIKRISEMMWSCLYTMGISCKYDPRQAIPESPTIPNKDVRELRAKLILEEALETIHALGFEVFPCVTDLHDGLTAKSVKDNYEFRDTYIPNMEEIIDGCVDLMYVATGCLAAHGVPDLPHILGVCQANDAKFPGGVPVMDATGKYLKPPGWKAPDHSKVTESYIKHLNLKSLANNYIEGHTDSTNESNHPSGL